MLVSIRKYQNSNIPFASFNPLMLQEKSKIKSNPLVACFCSCHHNVGLCQFEYFEQEVKIPVLIHGQKKEKSKDVNQPEQSHAGMQWN